MIVQCMLDVIEHLLELLKMSYLIFPRTLDVLGNIRYTVSGAEQQEPTKATNAQLSPDRL